MAWMVTALIEIFLVRGSGHGEYGGNTEDTGKFTMSHGPLILNNYL